MGLTTSKPTRKLTKALADATKTVNRSSDINQLPSLRLKQQFEENYNKQAPNVNTVPVPDESTNNQEFKLDTNASFDPSFLKKKLKHNKELTHSQVKTNLPEGKDGFDPHEAGTSTYDSQFVSSINNLGRQIHSHSASVNVNPNSNALKQLKFRKQLFEQGENELKSHKDPKDSGDFASTDMLLRTMVHPRTLGAILTDMRDPRIKNESTIKDYQLSPTFLQELGTRYKVCTNTVIIEEKTKEGEIGHKVTPPTASVLDYNEKGELADAEESERYKSLKKRISLDD